MFAALAHEVDQLRVPVDGPALLELLAIRDQLDAVACEAVGEFDAARLWDLDAATSMVAWLRDWARMTPGQASRLVRTAKRVRVLPVTLEEWKAGSISGGQVEVIVANVRGDTDAFAQIEPDLIPLLRELSVEDTTRVLHDWRTRVDAEAGPDDPVDIEVPSRLHHSRLLDRRGRLDADLAPEDDQIVRTALRVAETRDLDGEPGRAPAERRADALTDICQHYLDNQQTRPGGRHRPHLNLLVDLDTMTGRFVDGPTLTRETIERYFCDSALHRLVHQGRSAILDYGMATRVLTAALWAVLVVRDEHCRFPGCDRPSTWCDGHHVIWFSHHGPTRPDNLVLLCRRHHKRLHQPGWHAKLLPDATLEVTDPAASPAPATHQGC